MAACARTLRESLFLGDIIVNLRAPILLTHAMLPLLEKGSRPIVMNVSSIAALSIPAGQSVYSASKAAVTAFSHVLRKEWNPRGIRVTVIHSAGVSTWNAPEPYKLLRPEDVGRLIHFILTADRNCQIDEVTLSALGG
jgi:NADP-dependent 3-hydroxy acid dehydrogenase YdfG